MGCEYHDNDLILFFYDELSPSDKKKMEEHLRDCYRCSESLKKIEFDLRKVKIDTPEMSDAFWTNFRIQVNKKIDSREKKWKILPVNSRTVQTALAGLLLLVTIAGGVKIVQDKQEEKFIMKNIDLIMNMEMIEDLEILEHLEELETV